MHFTSKIISTSILFLSAFIFSQNSPDIPGFLGTPPAKACWIIKQLNTITASTNKALRNRLIIHGPPGNGKSLLAHKIAELTNRTCIQLDGPSIVNQFQGSGAEKISKLFAEIIDTIEQDKTSVIIFIDEIDAIACEQASEPLRIDFKAALQQLWLEMDRYKNDPRIFIIVATNNFKRMDKTFLDRFGNNIIEVKNPDAATRSLILEHYFRLYSITLTKEFLSQLVIKTKGLSIRSLEDLANDVSIATNIDNYGIVTQDLVLATLTNIKKKFNTPNDQQWQAKLDRANLYICIASGVLLGLVNSFSLYDRAVEYLS